jgi:hypothetical protein
MYTHPPYELSPGILWFQMENGTSRGFNRLIATWGGSPLDWSGYQCAPDPLIEGQNRVWTDCRIVIGPAEPPAAGGLLEDSAADGAGPAEIALFGSILERDGLFKFVSYSNDL